MDRDGPRLAGHRTLAAAPKSRQMMGSVTAGYEDLSTPIGSLHWAGTEMSNVHQGYVEGSLHAAYRACDEVLSALTAADHNGP